MSNASRALESLAKEPVSQTGSEYLERLRQRRQAAAAAPFTVDEHALFGHARAAEARDGRPPQSEPRAVDAVTGRAERRA